MSTTLLSGARVARVRQLMSDADDILRAAIARHITGDGREVAAVCALFSGGNDSTVLTHLFRGVASHAVHINTGIGIEQTRQYVRDTCAAWGLPLIEQMPTAGNTYEELVVERGFPGPAHHWKMYTRLKERGLEAVRNQLNPHPRRARVVFLAGRRRDESNRRASVPESGRKGSIVWVSPLVDWTAADLNTYRAMHPGIARNEVSDLLHMSGECLCGAFAKKDELDEIGSWYPQVREDIEALEGRVRAAGHPEQVCKWGWGAYRGDVKRSKSGMLCSSCEAR